ncbi:MAG: hypothetical protein AAFY26_09430 [Cyanobacteria bacterium J06638_22]
MTKPQATQLELDLLAVPAIASYLPPAPSATPLLRTSDRIQVVAIASHSPEILGRLGKVQRVMQGAVVVVFAVLDELPELGAIAFEPRHLSRVDTDVEGAIANDTSLDSDSSSQEDTGLTPIPILPDVKPTELVPSDRVEIIDVILHPRRLIGQPAIVDTALGDEAYVLMERLDEKVTWTFPDRCLRKIADPTFRLIEPASKAARPKVEGDYRQWQRTFWVRFAATNPCCTHNEYERQRVLREFAWKYETDVGSEEEAA